MTSIRNKIYDEFINTFMIYMRRVFQNVLRFRLIINISRSLRLNPFTSFANEQKRRGSEIYRLLLMIYTPQYRFNKCDINKTKKKKAYRLRHIYIWLDSEH